MTIGMKIKTNISLRYEVANLKLKCSMLEQTHKNMKVAYDKQLADMKKVNNDAVVFYQMLQRVFK